MTEEETTSELLEIEPHSKEEKLALEKEKILTAVADAHLDTLTTKVAWILNHYPETRDSDITLQIRYWQTFENDIFLGGSVSVEDLHQLKRLTSIARARATVQNTHNLFLASEDVRKKRGTLEDAERTKHRESFSSQPTYSVYADESGKGGEYLIVGSLWLLNGIESRNIYLDFERWRSKTSFTDEIHFTRISNSNIHRYFEVLDILLRRSAALSFKAIKLKRSGLGNQQAALEDMFYHMIVRGVQHEDASGRAPLPRNFQLWIDSEEESKDRLFIANLKDRLEKATTTIFNEKLYISDLFTIDSKGTELIQLADLFAASVNRVVNSPGSGGHAKDQFATEFLRKFGLDEHQSLSTDSGNMVVIENL